MNLSQRDLAELFDPKGVNKGIVYEGDQVEFVVNNNSPYDIESFIRSCNCMGKITRTPKQITGSVKAVYQGNQQEVHRIGDKWYLMYNTQRGPQFFDPEIKKFIDAPDTVDEIASALHFNQTLTLLMDDGQLNQIVNDEGELTDNPNKLKAYITLQFWVMKKPS